MKDGNLNFEELSDQVLMSALRIDHGSELIDVVFDVYQMMSIKGVERSMKGTETGLSFTNIIPGHKIQQWRRVLYCGISQVKLINFMVSQWKKPNIGKNCMSQ